ncbi:MAG: ABC transporter ATP-binding protein [Clostridiales bacterium]|nr:ABC transporter ATP-binding protein [Clostridiales bacterium]
MNDNGLVIRNMNFSYKDHIIFQSVNYEFQKGKVYILIARNGAGKSTLFKLISNEYKDYEGSIKVSPSISVHQQNPVYFDDMTVKENIECFLYLLGTSLKTEEIIQYYELEEIQKKVAKKLSGGEKQKLYLAITGLKNDEVYLYDEADSALDPVGRKFYYSILKKRAAESKIVIAITHHITEAINYADEICFLFNKTLNKISISDLPDNFLELNEDKMLEYLEGSVQV